MPFSEEMRQLLTANNFQFLFNGLKIDALYFLRLNYF